ncbi:MAG: hypothetical protein HY692_04045, partial [Cyanobacteria bacterium NC_groundwater_1444_Ag_S-0.65um_54_12]|nr:hypothetical protein [Cyanobacteria bacterium NC_groundwater_1444_Ag_S-0.65um_54_12]
TLKVNGFYNLWVKSGELVASMSIAAGTQTIMTVMGNGQANDDGDGGPAAVAGLDGPTAVAAAGDGTIYVADGAAGKIRAIDPAGLVRTIRDRLNFPRSLAVAPDGSLYVVERRGSELGKLSRLSGNTFEQLATGSLKAVAVGPAGQVVALEGNEIRHIAGPAGLLVEGLTNARGLGAISLAFAENGQLLIGGSGLIWSVIGKEISVLAGSGTERSPKTTALAAQLGTITAIAFNAGIPYFLDGTAGLLRRIDTDGTLTTVAGNGYRGSYGSEARFSGNGLALGVSLQSPLGLCALPAGGLLIADRGNHRLLRYLP